MKPILPLIYLFLLCGFAPYAFCSNDPSSKDGDTISVDFSDESRLAILRNVAELYKIEITFPSEFRDSRVSVKLRDVTWRQLVSEVLEGSGYDYIDKNSKVFVVRSDGKDLDLKLFLVGEWRFGIDHVFALEVTRSYFDNGKYIEKVRSLDSDKNRSPLREFEMEGEWLLVGDIIEIAINKTSDQALVPTGKILKQRILKMKDRRLILYDDDKRIGITATRIQP